ncbi:MAG: VOC family protein [bacterium]
MQFFFAFHRLHKKLDMKPDSSTVAKSVHRSRLGAVVIDCQTDDLAAAAEFWAAAFGVSASAGVDEKYATLGDGKQYPKMEVQAVAHESRVHLDIETDDREAECARLEALGARRVEAIKDWIVMEAPSGHRFCLIKPQGDDFLGDAAVWEG